MLQYILILAFAALIASYLYLRTQPELSRGKKLLLASLRGLSLAILLLLLISPIYYYRSSRKLSPMIITLLDNSASMKLTSGSGPKDSKLYPEARKLAELFKEQGYATREFSFASGLEGDPGSSLLSPALEALAGEIDLERLGGIILASDGWLRDEKLSLISRLGIPFYVVSDTIRSQNPDLAVLRTQNNRYAYRGEPSILRAEIQATAYSGPTQVKLFFGSRLIAQKAVNLRAGEAQSVDFTQSFTSTGFVSYRVEISAAGIQERALANNSLPGGIEILADKEKIVLISDKPGWDNKFILDVIAANNRWEAEHYTLKNNRIFRGETAVTALPADNLAALVIINNGSLVLPNDTRDYILQANRRGIGILYQGAPLASLESILPIAPSNVTAPYNGFLSWTSAAGAYPMLSLEEGAQSRIPPVDYYYVNAKRQAQIPVRINNPQASPAIAVTNGTGGKVLAMAFLNLWKWQMQDSSGSYNKLVNASLTWLSNRSEGSFRPIYKNSYLQGEEILIGLQSDDSIRQSRLDLNPLLIVYDKDNKEVFRDYMTVNEAEYRLGLELDKPGDYRFEISDKASGERAGGYFNLAEGSIEARDFDYNIPLLAWIASESGGRIVDSAYKPIPAEPEIRIQSHEIPLYRKWYVISLFILLFCVELFLRRRWGLL